MPPSHSHDLPGALLVATAALCFAVAAACAILLAAFVVVAGHAEVAPRGGTWAACGAAAAVACGNVAALIALTRARGGLRPVALAAAWALAFAWPLSGAPVAAAIAAMLATGLVVRWGGPAGATRAAGVPAAAVLAVAALALATVAFGGARGVDAGIALAAEPPGGHAVPATARADAGSDPGASARARVAGPPPAARAVRAYYRALDRRDYARAWRALSPAVRTGFGGLEHWRAGFASTLSSRPGDLRVATGDRTATVDHVLTARDRTPCGVVVQRFAVRWQLRLVAGAWRATALTGQPLGAAAGAACA